MTDIPVSIIVLFLAAAGWTLYGVYRASHRSRPFILLALLWLLLQSFLTLSGFYMKTDGFPPRRLLLVAPVVAVILYMLLNAKSRKFMSGMDLGWCLIIHIVRIPVEIGLFMLYQRNLVPKRMTFEGGNWDIFSGISVIIIWIVYRRGTLGKFLLLGWNVVCTVLLLNIMVRANLPPGPFGQANLAFGYFPITLLPAFIAPAMLFMHLVIFVKIFRYESKIALPVASSS